MNNMADRNENKKRSVSASSSSLLSHHSTIQQPWPLEDKGAETEPYENHCTGKLSNERPGFYEDMFCISPNPLPFAPLAGALVTSLRPQSDVVRQGYLGRLERKHRRYFVLRAGSHIGLSRLEWYQNQEKFKAMEKSAGKPGLFGATKQGVIYLRCCLGVSRVGSSRRGHTVVLYARDQTIVLVMEDQQEQEDWYAAIKKVMEEDQVGEERTEEEDDGYCTLPPAAYFKEVWPVTVKPRGLGSSKSLTGENRLCLTGTSLILIRLGAGSDLPSVMIPLLSVRRFGHLDGLFYLELGRSAPNGPGEIWMEAKDQGNPALAQHIHEAVREMLRTVRALPDFSRSPTSCLTQPQALLASKRCRPKYRDKPGSVRPLGPQMLFPRTPDTQMSTVQSNPKPCNPDKTRSEFSCTSTSQLSSSRVHQSSMSEAENYIDMDRVCDDVAACRIQEQELEKEEEGPYMTMSPQVGHSPSGVSQDDYMAMASPQKPGYSSSAAFLQASFSSSNSDISHHQTNEQFWLQEQKPAPPTQQCCPPAAGHTSPPSASRSPQASPHLDTGQRGQRCQRGQRQAAPDPHSARRHLLSFCLPSCIQAQDRS